jgi:predicted nuclease of predicted toxin-antitoxin system
VRFKLDENLPTEFARALKLRGHDALTVRDQGLGGSADPLIAEAVQKEGRILATLDRDFADIRRYPPAQFAGILVFRVRRQDPAHLLALLDQAMDTMDSEQMKGELWIVEETGVRRRAE